MDAIKPVFLRVMEKSYGKQTSIKDKYGLHTYEDLLSHSKTLARQILCHAHQRKMITSDSHFQLGSKVAFLSSNSVTYTIMQWAIWMSGGVAVPLAKAHPEKELHYTIENSGCILVMSDKEYSHKINSIANIKADIFTIDDVALFKSKSKDISLSQFVYHQGERLKFEITEDDLQDTWNNIQWYERDAMIIYTSGTTGRPKGVVITFLNLHTQISAITKVWDITHFDTTLHVLPLHHVHGVVNVLACSLWTGGMCVMMDGFNPSKVWNLLIGNNGIDVFHGVPSMYALLIEHYENCHDLSKQKKEIRNILRSKMRLMVSGSAPLPEKILNKWKVISGHTLLERYGMSEVGMVLTNPLHGKRVPGAVGRPFPSVEIKIVGSDGEQVLLGDEDKLVVLDNKLTPGELYVKGKSVFREYLNLSQATSETFTKDGWFKTGDTAIYDEKEDVIRIMGRTSVDIIKTGGFKISALDIERSLMEHPRIKEAVILGVDDSTWGQVVVTIAVLNNPSVHLTLKELQEWLEKRIPAYSLPRKLMLMSSIPRNAMGKVNKKQLIVDHFTNNQL